MRPFSTFVLLLIAGIVQSQSDLTKYGNTITREDAETHMSIIASDALEGRMTGSRGQKMAAAYIASAFREDGLLGIIPGENPYYYSIPFEKVAPGNTYLMQDAKKLENLKEIVYWGSANTSEETVELIPVANASDEYLSTLDITGKALLVTTGGGFQKFGQIANKLYQQGAALAVFSISDSEDDFRNLLAQFRGYLGAERVGLKSQKEESRGMIFISPSDTYNLLGTTQKNYRNALDKAGKGDFSALEKMNQKELTFRISTKKADIESENVIGYVEGNEYPDEVIIITAHYDHLGKKGDVVFYGADDNGSGTCALLEIGQAFGAATNDGVIPKRSILLMALTGEEEGLLGSAYYSEHPVFPLENTVANLNMDMVGHLDDAHPDDPNFVSIVGSDWLSSDLHRIHEEANEKFVNIELDYTYNSKDHPERFYYRSDQYNFAKHNIPVIFYTSGDHEDYHKPTDTREKIKYERIEKVARLVFYTAWEIANREERIKVDNN